MLPRNRRNVKNMFVCFWRGGRRDFTIFFQECWVLNSRDFSGVSPFIVDASVWRFCDIKIPCLSSFYEVISGQLNKHRGWIQLNKQTSNVWTDWTVRSSARVMKMLELPSAFNCANCCSDDLLFTAFASESQSNEIKQIAPGNEFNQSTHIWFVCRILVSYAARLKRLRVYGCHQ